MPNHPPQNHEPHAKILVVDDNPNNIDILLNVLEPAGYNLAIAKSGEQAIKIASHFLPDLILMDVMMPGLDGFETCRFIKQDNAIKDIPIIFVTAKTDSESIVKGFQIGGVDYILKPVREEEVLARVRLHLKLQMLIKKQDSLIRDLKSALDKVKLLSGLVPICANCKKVRNDQGYWLQIETYIQNHSEAEFSHGICPECAVKLYPDLETTKKYNRDNTSQNED